MIWHPTRVATDQRLDGSEPIVTGSVLNAGGPRSVRFWVVRVIVALIIAVVGAGIAVGIVALQTKTYRSVATLAIDQPLTLAQTTDPGEFAKLVALRYEYVGLASTAEFSDQVAASSGLSAAEVHSSLFTTVPPNSLLFSVGAQSQDKTTVTKVAQEMANGIVRFVSRQQAAAGVPAKIRVRVRVVTPAGAPVVVSPSQNRELGAAGLTALILFVLSLSVLALRRRT